MSNLRKKHKSSKAPKIAAIFLAIILLFSFAASGIIAATIFAGSAFISNFFKDLPDIKDFSPVENALTSKIFASDGKLIGTLHGEQNRELVSFEQIPKNLIHAVIAIEDERFYEHKGIDFEAIFRSLLVNLKSGAVTQGGSTLTQQYIRNVYIPEEKSEITLERKIKEAALAYQLEKIYSKDEILEMYLNTVYFGEGAYGVQAAAKTFFNKNVQDLNLEECALIAGLPQSPSQLSPYENRQAAIVRRNNVLAKMNELGYISKEEYTNAVKQPVILERAREESTDFAPYFVEYVKQELIKKYGINKVFKGGFEIYTTLDPNMQVYAEDAIKEILPDPEDPTGAMIAMDPRNGYIKALVGGKDFNTMKFNLATQSKRQPGSTFKVFALIAALEQGVSPYMTFNPNGPIKFEIPSSKPWEVSNYMGEKFPDGTEMSIIDATVKSVNVVYSQLIMRIGGEAVSRIANAMGIQTPLEGYPAIGLGGLTTGVSPLEVCTAFSTIADYGVKHDPVAILKVVDKDKNIIYEYQEPPKNQVISPINAYRAIEIMKQVIQRGTGTRARLEDREAAGKTGTTDEGENAWFTGFTTNLAASFWMGYPEENKKMGAVHDLRVQGGAHPAMMWKLFMEKATKSLPIEKFQKPKEDLFNLQVTTAPDTGQVMIPNRFTPPDQITVAQFHYGAEPRDQMPISDADMPILPFVCLIPVEQARQMLLDTGFTNIEFINEVYSGVPSGYTHRQEPLWDMRVEKTRLIKVWVNP
ncbi:MAG: PBP1A family penicillin-binding protein [Actinobacteria bacterium]|nr:PBP1A family penicillin-binding protein [Actinomycetota bacterium]